MPTRFEQASASASTRWQALPSGRFDPEQHPYLIVFLGAIVTIAMLLAFYQVVCDAVDRGELRRQTMALHAEAAWHCGTLDSRSAGESCLRQLNTSLDVGRK